MAGRVEVPITVLDAAGNAISGASVRVKNRVNGVDRTLYLAETGGTTVANPMTTNAAGRVDGWVDQGRHMAVISGTGITTYTENFDAASAQWPTPIPTGSPLPVSGFDGEEIIYRAATNNLWKLRWNSGTARWDFIGGTPLRSYVTGSVAFTGAAVDTLKEITGGPTVVVPFAGDYEVEHSCTASAATANLYSQVGVRFNPGPYIVQPGANGSGASYYAGGSFQNWSYKRSVAGLADGVTAALWHASGVGSLSMVFYDLTIALTPIAIHGS